MSTRHERARRDDSEHIYDVVSQPDDDAGEMVDAHDAGDCDDDECARRIVEGRVRAASWEVL
jgi:hypothetical protein